MEVLSRIALCVLVCVLLTGVAWAVEANPEPFELSQPDGLNFTAHRVGDEWNSWVETPAGYTVCQAADGWWIYAGTDKRAGGALVVGYDQPEGIVMPHFRERIRPVPHGVRSPIVPEQLWKRLDAAKVNPVSHKVLVILVEFSDQAHVGSTAADWASEVFTNATNSVADYYDEVSYGQMTMDPAAETQGTTDDGVVGWLNLGTPHPNTAGATGDANRQLAKDAIMAADPYVDYASFDSNGDGYVSLSELSIVVVAAGYEASYDSTMTPNVWGHHWSLGWTVPAPTCDGVAVGLYTGDSRSGGYVEIGERHESNGYPAYGHTATIGIICHELGHDALGLPDLYDTSGASEGIGIYGLMGAGSWGWQTGEYSGTTPVHFCAWSKIYSGFITPVTATRGTHSVPTSAVDPTVYILNTSDPNQYFLVENRQLAGYDRGLYARGITGGLAVWHVDEAQSGNSDVTHKLVDLEEADGQDHLDSRANGGDANDFYYAGNVTVFDPTTTPNSDLYDGSVTRIGIRDVSSSSPTMTAVFSPALADGDLDASTATDATDLTILADFLGGNIAGIPAGDTTADIDYSGLVDATDLSCLLNMLAGNL